MSTWSTHDWVELGVPAYSITIFRERYYKYALVIPVLNENGRLSDQLNQIMDSCPKVDVIIADGGSIDGSTDTSLLAELGVTALLTKTGLGKLSAQLRMAMQYCMKNGYEAVITMDGNGKDDVDGIAAIATALEAGYDFVQGSRFLPGGAAINTPLDRYLAIRFLHAPITSLAAGHWYTDTTNGFRGLSMRLLTDARVAPLRDLFDTYELLAYLPIQSARLGYRIVEVPVSRSYPLGKATPTKIHGVLAHIKILRILLAACTGAYRPKS